MKTENHIADEVRPVGTTGLRRSAPVTPKACLRHGGRRICATPRTATSLTKLNPALDCLSLTIRTTLFLSLTATTATAQGLRDSDRTMDAAELTDTLTGQVVEFFDGSKSRYSTDGTYAYTYADDDPPWTGRYTLNDDSTVCVAFDNGSARCDTFVFAGDRLTLIIADGTRFPVRGRVAE